MIEVILQKWQISYDHLKLFYLRRGGYLDCTGIYDKVNPVNTLRGDMTLYLITSVYCSPLDKWLTDERLFIIYYS